MPDDSRRVWRTTPLVVALLVLAAVLAAAAWWQVQSDQPPSPGPGPSPSVSPTATTSPGPRPVEQQTLLVQVRDDRDLSVCNIQMGVGGAPDTAVFVSVPPGLLVNAGAAGEMTLARTALLSDTLASQTALALQLGLRVDGTMTMDRLAFAGLVDAVGGVSVDGPAGRTDLTGTEAAEYAITRDPSMSEAERMARCTEVWQTVILRLPDDIDRLRQALISLGALSRITLPVEVVAEMLLEARSEIRDGGRTEAVLPTAIVRPGSDQMEVALQPASSTLLRSVLPEAVLGPGDSDPPRVYVISAAADPFAVVDVRERLVDAGFGVVVGEPFGTSTVTRIVVANTDQLDVGREMAEVLGLPVETVRVGIMQDPSADAQVVVGSDPLP